MREIKFRAYCLSNNTMWYSASLERFFSTIEEDDIVMQFTGLRDKNGKEIYEGDILRWPHLGDNSPIVSVYYNEDECSFFGNPLNLDKETESYLDKLCEVIGNIHENPELL